MNMIADNINLHFIQQENISHQLISILSFQ